VNRSERRPLNAATDNHCSGRKRIKPAIIFNIFNKVHKKSSATRFFPLVVIVLVAVIALLVYQLLRSSPDQGSASSSAAGSPEGGSTSTPSGNVTDNTGSNGSTDSTGKQGKTPIQSLIELFKPTGIPVPAIYLTYGLPAEITNEKEAVAYVSDIAKDSKCMVWLNFSRREGVVIDRSGELNVRYEIKG
jgi:hypothetical protein